MTTQESAADFRRRYEVQRPATMAQMDLRDFEIALAALVGDGSPIGTGYARAEEILGATGSQAKIAYSTVKKHLAALESVNAHRDVIWRCTLLKGQFAAIHALASLGTGSSSICSDGSEWALDEGRQATVYAAATHALVMNLRTLIGETEEWEALAIGERYEQEVAS